jgi:hypothetical protein
VGEVVSSVIGVKFERGNVRVAAAAFDLLAAFANNLLAAEIVRCFPRATVLTHRHAFANVASHS